MNTPNKTIAIPVIEKGIPTPRGRFSITGKRATLRAVIKRMKPGDSFVWPENKAPFRAAEQLGIGIKTRQIGDGTGYRIWRVFNEGLQR